MDIDEKELDTVHEKITVKKELYIPIEMIIKKLGLNFGKRDVIAIEEQHDFSDDLDDDFENIPVAGIVIMTKDGRMNLTRKKKNPKDKLPQEEREKIDRKHNLKILIARGKK